MTIKHNEPSLNISESDKNALQRINGDGGLEISIYILLNKCECLLYEPM